MIHFRLRRSLRLAVDLLSLNFAGSFIHSRSAPLVSRRTPANASTFFQPAAFPWLRLPRPPLPELPAIRSPRHHASSHGRRYLASSGLLLALSIEVCGCNPVADSGLASNPFNYDRSGRETGLVAETLSFYHPADTIDNQITKEADAPSSSLITLRGPTSAPRTIPLGAKSPPWAIPESVYLIYRSRRPGELVPRQPPLATAFVLSVPIPGRVPIRIARFLVTARHVVDPQWAGCLGRNPSSIDLRLNRRAGGVGYETVTLQTGAAPHFFTPSDPTADLAIITLDSTLIANLDDYKLLDVPDRILLSDSDMPLLRPDQPVMTASLSNLSAGDSVSFPVFNAGSLAKMPAEAVNVRCGEAPLQSNAEQSPTTLLHVWFINAGVPRSVSGAPVFTSIAPSPGAFNTPVLLGVQSVVWPDKGMAGITPAPILGELIRSALRQTAPNSALIKGPPLKPLEDTASLY